MDWAGRQHGRSLFHFNSVSHKLRNLELARAWHDKIDTRNVGTRFGLHLGIATSHNNQ